VIVEGAHVMATLTPEEAQSRIRELDGWTLDGKAIRKQFVFRGFPEAVAFVSRLVPYAEAADHHPDVLINYKRVTLTYSTHSEGGLTAKDFDGAKTADRVAAEKAL
jgi:4a-hydroxytetrahydrobiopterin dehydratase